MLYGPVTSKQNTKNGFFLTDLIIGDNVTIYIFEPNAEKGKSKLTITGVVHGYKNIFPDLYGNLGASLDCNIDIACHPVWDTESDAIALILLANGTEWCSGSLLMTANQSFEPYFLSAFHCIDVDKNEVLSTSEISNAENWMFKFQYKMGVCNGSFAATGITFNGAEFRAAWDNTDFALMEMNNSPVGNSQFSWLGWDRSGSTPTSGTGIHHPKGDVMKISFDNNNLTSNSSEISWSSGAVSPINTHWVVDYDSGTTEGGSSGSPLFDQNGSVIGQLHGGQTGCAPVTKYYGQFHNSWTGGGTDETRLSNWLDTDNNGTLITNTSRSPYITGSSIVCSTSNKTYTLNNLPSGSLTVTWSRSSNLSFVSQSTNSYTVKASSSFVGASGWVQAAVSTGTSDPYTIRKNFWVGRPSQPTINPSGYPTIELNEFQYVTIRAINTPGYPTSFNWWVTGNPCGVDIFPASDGKSCTFEAIEPSWNNFYFNTTNVCGTSPSAGGVIEVINGGGGGMMKILTVSPNPANDYIEAYIENLTEEERLDNEKLHIKIVNSNSIPVYNGTTQQKKFQINTSSLHEGVYYLLVQYKNQKYSTSILISR